MHWNYKNLKKILDYTYNGSKVTKFLRLPTPKELGKSDYNALPADFLSNPEGTYTWGSYYAEMKRDYPVKFFIEHTFTTWFSNKIIAPISKFKYWFKSHTYKKYHLLDLRNDKNGYKYGWIDADGQMLFALMAIMDNFIIEQDTEKHLTFLREELSKDPECKDFNWKDKIKFCEDLLDIQNWWRFNRQIDYNNLNKLDGVKYFEHEEILRINDNTVMKKLIDMRHYMWT